MVRDGDAVSVAAEILEHIVGAAEGRFAIDDPVFSEQRSQPGSKEFGLCEERQIPGKVQLAKLKGGLESGDELAAKHTAEHLDREKEARLRSNPAGVIERESAGGDNAMDMRMKLELLVPGMQHAEEADLSPEMGGVASDFEQSFCAGTKQQTIDYFFVLQSQGRQLGRQGEDDVDVGRGQQFTTTRRDPAFTRTGLTLRAVPIAATVVGDGGTMPAASALIDMAAQSGGATARDGPQDFKVGPAEPRTIPLDEVCTCTANDVGHL